MKLLLLIFSVLALSGHVMSMSKEINMVSEINFNKQLQAFNLTDVWKNEYLFYKHFIASEQTVCAAVDCLDNRREMCYTFLLASAPFQREITQDLVDEAKDKLETCANNIPGTDFSFLTPSTLAEYKNTPVFGPEFLIILADANVPEAQFSPMMSCFFSDQRILYVNCMMGAE